MHSSPTSPEQAAANWRATAALFDLQQRGHLKVAERFSFGWAVVTAQGVPPVLLRSPEAVMRFIAEQEAARG